MRGIAGLALLFAMLLSVRGDQATDRKLARQMVGIWRSDRHTYVYAADGRWWFADSYRELDHPESGRGRWKVEDHQLVKEIENLSFGGFWGLRRERIIKFTPHEVIFDGWSMKRWTREDVKRWSSPP